MQAMLLWLTLPFYDFCGFRSVAVNSVYKLQFFTFLQIGAWLKLRVTARQGTSYEVKQFCPNMTQQQGSSSLLRPRWGDPFEYRHKS